MSNNSFRIRTTPNGTDKYLKVKLDQEFDFIEVLSLKISQEEAYRNFCSDYGVVVGRVIINSGFGVQNARVSIFIPIDSIDKEDPILNGLYPYEIITDKDIDGKRYNLLPKNSETDNDCFTSVGTFPTKREVLDDPEMGDIYCKYYKFTTSTNYAGDFMIFGVPVGNYVLHVDADISDIGIASQRPYDSISQGAPLQMFDSPTKFKGGTNLDKLVQIKTINSGVNVQPFWGEVNSCEIGITRIDVDLNYNIKPSAIFMGSIYGDQDKNSVNKRCRPRMKMGKICEQITGEGSIEMIRKNIDGEIEKLDVEGGRLIDQNGAWAYQIPMNLDYIITDEFGRLVPSQDPNKGIPTRTSVRFRIGLDETGGLGRLRTRAQYLVPHNPPHGDPSQIDYEFGPLTKDTSFRDLYWNKIYSVSNFISRFQKSNSTFTTPVKNRNMNGLKDVDDCPGDKNPFPFNRVNTVFNPLFFIICLIMRIIEIIIWLINFIINPILNLLISFWNAVMGIFCSISRWRIPIVRRRIFRFLSFGCRWKVNYIPCIYGECPTEEKLVFAPGCDNGKGRAAVRDKTGKEIHTIQLFALSSCIATEMARAMNLFQFDFYNDWVTGSLFAYLLKYKKRRKSEKYCNYDCTGSNCFSSILLDTCFDGGSDSQNKIHSAGLTEGLIKKYNGELYYAASTKDANLKLYATEITNLGAVFNCDWQGIPKIQEFLTPTTYKIPPNVDEFDNSGGVLEVSGQIDIGAGFGGLFFDINCLGLKSDYKQCLNIRKSCEFGVDLDQIEADEVTGTPIAADHIIGADEINSQYGQYVRDTLFGLNNVTGNLNVSLPYDTGFNLTNQREYNFATVTTNGNVVNGTDYITYRGLTTDGAFQQPTHSYYMYFGILPGKTGLEKMNEKFFTKCYPKIALEFLIKIVSTTAISQSGSTDGSVTFSIISGTGPFIYTVSGPNGYTATNTIGSSANTTTVITETLNNLAEGSYTISVIDASGNVITQTFEIGGPIPLYADAFVSSENTSTGTTANGEITVISLGGGSGTYIVTLYDNNGNIVSTPNNPTTATQVPIIFGGLSVNTFSNGQTPPHYGYYIVVTDTGGSAPVYIYDLSITGFQPLSVGTNVVHVLCYGGDTGGITISPSGGQEPLMINTYNVGTQNEDPNPYQFQGFSGGTLIAGTYSTTVTDSASPAQVVVLPPIIVGHDNPEMKIAVNQLLLPRQCNPLFYQIEFSVVGSGTNRFGFSYLNNPSYNNNIYYQFNFDSEEGADGNLIWRGNYGFPQNSVSSVPNTINPLTVMIPYNAILESLKIRITDPQGICGSDYSEDESDLGIEEMVLPLIPLSATNINLDGSLVDNSKQCVPNQVSFKFNISHLLIGMNYRDPYIVEYRIRPYNGNVAGAWGPSIFANNITSNSHVYTQTVAGANVTKVDIEIIKVTDNVGCESQPFMLPQITLPTTQLQAVWTVTNVGGNTCKKYVTVSGGLPLVTIPNYLVTAGIAIYDGNINGNTVYQVFCNQFLNSTIVDSVGCELITNG